MPASTAPPSIAEAPEPSQRGFLGRLGINTLLLLGFMCALGWSLVALDASDGSLAENARGVVWFGVFGSFIWMGPLLVLSLVLTSYSSHGEKTVRVIACIVASSLPGLFGWGLGMAAWYVALFALAGLGFGLSMSLPPARRL